jgi:hypothetical protein
VTIEGQEAAAALDDIEQISRRVRQSTTYQLAGLLAAMWGVLVFAGNLATWLSPRTAGYVWFAIYIAGIVGSFAVSAYDRARTGVRSFDVRMMVALLLFFAFGFLCVTVLGHFTPRQQGTFWPIYFMLFYSIAGLWFGYAFIAIGFGITALTLIGYFFVGEAFPLWMAFVNGGGLILGGLWMRRS